jgi:TolB-like protein
LFLGEVSQVGRRYIVNAKIIDVTQGRNIRADSVSADDLSQLADTG